MIFPAAGKPASSSAGGTRVVLPAPGGARSTSDEACRSAATMSPRTSSIGSGAFNRIKNFFQLLAAKSLPSCARVDYAKRIEARVSSKRAAQECRRCTRGVV
jgi:hypothetical protein